MKDGKTKRHGDILNKFLKVQITFKKTTACSSLLNLNWLLHTVVFSQRLHAFRTYAIKLDLIAFNLERTFLCADCHQYFGLGRL